ncbi:non-ribosomal peptide synthetase [Actinophytocola oryzae]|uniref:Amino acid adenylation domain-containing protein n=1 Tax=Actinophytocola oryzae TaxID=502181 RepID=A0A4R7W155_9PSEU|nr:non-ribosomal peptide synthetase [Actinophytocola oryzae]TDV56266.1 amino acid adenylation domain-containing protein [Actinophytocola oryzae]
MSEFPASSAQQRMWFLQNRHPDTRAYHVTEAVRLRGPLDTGALEAAVAAMIERYEQLRAVFDHRDGELVQRILPVRCHLARARVARDDVDAWLAAETDRAFDLTAGPLHRATLLELGPDDHVLALSMHHIVTDGWSSRLLFADLGAAYRGEALGEAGNYRTAVARERAWLDSPAYAARLDAAAAALAGAPFALELPTDHPGGAEPARAGTVRVPLPEELTAGVTRRAGELGVTPFMLHAAAYAALLARHTGQDELVVGLPSAGREHPPSSETYGLFVNTVPLRVRLEAGDRWTELVGRVRDAALAAYELAEVPFDRLAARLGGAPVGAMLVVQPDDVPLPDLPGVESSWWFVDNRHTKFDLVLHLDRATAVRPGADEPEHGWYATLEYPADRVEAARASRLVDHYRRLLAALVDDPDTRVTDLDPDTEAERALRLAHHRLAEAPAPLDPVAAFGRLAARRPVMPAVWAGGTAVGYGVLADRVGALHAALLVAGVRPGDLVGVCLRRTPDLVAALLAILRCGAAYVPLDAGYPRDRLAFVAQDAGCVLILTEPATEGVLPAGVAPLLDVRTVPAAAAPPAVAVVPERTAYLIYTSGSTGRPKGVAIPHRALHAFLGWAATQFGPNDLAVVLGSTSICFDLSVFELFLPLATGGSVRLVDDATDLVTTAGPAPTLVNTVPSAMAELLRVDSLPESTRVVNLAGEALPRTLVDLVHAEHDRVRVHNLYGPSEDTTYSTWTEVPRGHAGEPTIGRPVAGTNAYVLDERLDPVPVGVSGELYLGGLGVAQGYLGRPDLTAERFLPDPVTGGRMYRTGDRVRMTESGELRYLGRYDHQIKLRGYRIETGEIESRARTCPGVAQAVVAPKVVGDTTHLVCYWTGAADTDTLRAALAAELPGYMLPTYWVPLAEFPVNANGKTDRARLPEPVREAGDTAPTTGTERVMAELVGQVTKAGEVGADADFFALGGHSLLAMRLMVAVRERLGVEISLADIFAGRTVRALAARVDQELAHRPSLPPLRRRAGSGPAPLSFAQERMWLVEQLRPGTAMLNIGSALRLEHLDRPALHRALRALTDRHEALRLRVDRGEDGRLRQWAVDSRPVPLHEVTAAGQAEVDRLLAEAVATPFDLATEPPARWLLVVPAPRATEESADTEVAVEEPAGAVLALVIHHVVADARSVRLLFDELLAHYGGTPVGDVPVSVLDHAEWQRHLDLSFRRDVDYWRERLAGLPERLPLAFDHPPATAVSYRGARVTRRLPAQAVDVLVAAGGTTPFMTLLTVYQALMSRLSGQDDVVVGTPIANRDQAGAEDLVGCLLNTLALRADLTDRPSFTELLARTTDSCVEAFDHQLAPFELVVAALDAARTVEHTPVFQTMFVLHGEQERGAWSDIPPVATQYDVTLMVHRDERGWYADWDYRTDLFEPETVARFAGAFEALVGQAAAHPDLPLHHLPLCDPDTERRLLSLAGHDAPDVPAPATLPALFAARVAAHPDAPAVRDEDGVLTYRELDVASGGLAAVLLARGVRPDETVAVVLPRSRACVVALLAVARAGAGFLCLDPGLPSARMAWLARDAGAVLQVTNADMADRVDVPAVLVSETTDGPCDADGLTPDHLAYVIYTSGSTGTPKGVLLSHRGLAQLLSLHRDKFAVGPGSQVLQYAPYSFDASVWECVMGVLSGACLHLAPADALLPGAPLAATLAERRITHVTMPPSNLAMLETVPDSLAHLVLAGEACPAELVRRWGGRVHLWNAYGPTEATVCATIQDCAGVPDGQAPTIGTAFPGAEAYVLDAGMNVVPPGVPGELYLGGQGLARGYLNRPELTATAFVPHPCTPGARLYRTGDLARLTATGEIDFLGRADDQVKVRGIRIELGEVERVLVGLDPRVADAAVLVAGSGGDAHLIGFVAAPGDVDPAALREDLAARLPAYLVPAWLSRLDEFPLTGNGKLDRRALAALAGDHRPATRLVAPPRGPVEREVAEIWRELLPDNDFGREDSFFAVGGTSLTLTRLHERLDTHHPGALKLVDLFRLNTVAAIAVALAGAGTPAETAAVSIRF